MKDQPDQGLTRHSRTIERMVQERDSPGATSAGGHGADAPDNDTSQDPSSFQAGGSFVASANTAARRGDIAESATGVGSPEPTTREERIRQTAYRYFTDRGSEAGDATADWLRAEAEVDALDRDARAWSGTSMEEPSPRGY